MRHDRSRMDFYSPQFREAVGSAVRTVEGVTSAELVVAVQPTCGSYTHIDLSVGLAALFATLSVFLYHPEPFEFTYLPLELAAALGIGTLLSASVPTLRRAAAPGSLLDFSTKRAAKAAFLDLGIHRTKARTGILLFVAPFERRGVILVDVGVDEEALGGAWTACKERFERAVRSNRPADALLALRDLAPVLRESLPREDDDANELEDALVEVGS